MTSVKFHQFLDVLYNKLYEYDNSLIQSIFEFENNKDLIPLFKVAEVELSKYYEKQKLEKKLEEQEQEKLRQKLEKKLKKLNLQELLNNIDKLLELLNKESIKNYFEKRRCFLSGAFVFEDSNDKLWKILKGEKKDNIIKYLNFINLNLQSHFMVNIIQYNWLMT